MEYLEYVLTAWQYLPYIFYTFVFLTLIPKSLKKINDFAKQDYEANRNKWHRCYAPDNCCHSMEGQQLPKQKARKAVTRAYPKKQVTAKQEAVKTVAASNATEDSANIYKRQVHTHTNVNKIAKMFENGGVQKKINRVTPTVLPTDFRRLSMDFDDDEYYNKKDDFTISHQQESPLKKENVVLRRLSKLSQELEENNENSANVLNQISAEGQDVLNSSWRSEPINIQRRKRQVPSNLVFNTHSATPSTISPAPSSPLSSPHSANSPTASSPILRNAPVLNMNTSLEDLFVAIAKSAENPDSFLYAGCNSLSPVTSIDDILSQRRLSRPLSAYSISDLLNDEPNKGMDETYVENFLKVLNKT